MGRYALFALFLLVSCGKEVKISHKSLEYNSGLSDGKTTATDQEGTLIRGTKDSITTNGTTHHVSIFSSYAALEFIASKPLQTQLPVRYRGKLKDDELVLEVIATQN